MKKIGDDYRIYKIANDILGRTRNTKDTTYKYYGAKGILCKFEGINDLYEYLKSLPNYNSKMTIDRIDNSGHYEVGNLRWVTRKQNCRNRSTNFIVEYKGLKLSLTEMCERLNVPYDIVQSRIYTHKWSIIRALEQPFKRIKNANK
jgi:hypothetical protein